MKRFLCIILIVFSLIICSGVGVNNSLISITQNLSINAQIIEREKDYQVVVFEEKNLDKFVSRLGLEIICKKCIEDRFVIEAYTNKLAKHMLIKNRKVNIQISIFDGKCIVGYPLIKNSF